MMVQFPFKMVPEIFQSFYIFIIGWVAVLMHGGGRGVTKFFLHSICSIAQINNPFAPTFLYRGFRGFRVACPLACHKCACDIATFQTSNESLGNRHFEKHLRHKCSKHNWFLRKNAVFSVCLNKIGCLYKKKSQLLMKIFISGQKYVKLVILSNFLVFV